MRSNHNPGPAGNPGQFTTKEKTEMRTYKRGDRITINGRERLVEGFVDCIMTGKVILILADGARLLMIGEAIKDGGQ